MSKLGKNAIKTLIPEIVGIVNGKVLALLPKMHWQAVICLCY